MDGSSRPSYALDRSVACDVWEALWRVGRLTVELYKVACKQRFRLTGNPDRYVVRSICGEEVWYCDFQSIREIVDVTSYRTRNCGIVLSIDRVLDIETPSVHSPYSRKRFTRYSYYTDLLSDNPYFSSTLSLLVKISSTIPTSNASSAPINLSLSINLSISSIECSFVKCF